MYKHKNGLRATKTNLNVCAVCLFQLLALITIPYIHALQNQIKIVPHYTLLKNIQTIQKKQCYLFKFTIFILDWRVRLIEEQERILGVIFARTPYLCFSDSRFLFFIFTNNENNSWKTASAPAAKIDTGRQPLGMHLLT